VTTKLRDDSAEASIARLGDELVVVVVGARALLGIAVAGAQDRHVRAIAVGEGLNGHLEAAALADELEEGALIQLTIEPSSLPGPRYDAYWLTLAANRSWATRMPS